jgi:predicted RecB family endonuclease
VTRDAPHAEASSRQRQAADRRLPQALAGLLGIVLVTTGLAWVFLGLSLRSLESVFHDRVEALALLHTVNDELQHLVADVAIRAERGVVTTDSAAVTVRAAQVRADSAWQAYLRTWFTPAESTMVARISPVIATGIAAAGHLGDTLAVGDRDHVSRFLEGQVFGELDALSASLRELVSLQVGVTREAYDLSRARYRLAGRAFLGAVIGASVLVLVALLAGGRRSPIPVRRWTR